jgi:short-subunit dehydrogenase
MRRLAVISGATKGIGRAIVQQFASQGFDIVTCARNENELRQLQAEIEGQYDNCQVFVKKADLSIKSEVNSFVEFVHKIQQPVAVLVNNTGTFTPGQTHNEPDGTLENMIDTNLYSAYNLTRGLVGDMIRQQGGHIFNICSTASIEAYPNGGSYSISKFALYGFTKSLREELKPYNVKVTAILPGATLTSSWDGVELPEDRFMKADDVAKSIWAAYELSKSAVVEELIMRPQLGDIS